MCLELQLTHISWHIALTQKMQISSSGVIIWCVDNLHTFYSFRVMHEGKGKKDDERKNEINFFVFIVSTVRRVNGTLGMKFTLQYLIVFN